MIEVDIVDIYEGGVCLFACQLRSKNQSVFIVATYNISHLYDNLVIPKYSAANSSHVHTNESVFSK